MTPPDDRPFDAGLQPERTLLAWRRTCLSLAVGNAVAIKYLSDALGPWATLLGVAGLALTGVAWVLATLRYRRAHEGLVRDASLLLDGRLPALLAGAVLIASLAATVILVALWRPW
ncbi:MAG: DUF202 domain-containing protein [Microbacterium sp.]|uniref:DUF202 domain-containing protein n=1 Tax=Microbacterium sp. TaxID=51671 RepID=UPI001ACBF422|nr:DUF202 domain-containing protein [Microbacterium sp.]MBN9154841.1 DUF202 domain-containing protein [Microbacterium sp.]MBN9173815.1 DUF202 domain-containing protein [Microbacterium sp.]